MKKLLLIALLAVLVIAAGGFYVGLKPGESMMYHIPGTTWDGQVFYVVRDYTGCTVFIYARSGFFGPWSYYDDFILAVGSTAIEGTVRPNLYCNPSGTLDAYSNSKIRVYTVHIPTVKTSHQPYVPQLTPYP